MELFRDLIRMADEVPDLSYAGFKVLWSAHGLPLLHLSESLSSKDFSQQVPDVLEPPEVWRLRRYFDFLVEQIVAHTYAGDGPHEQKQTTRVLDAQPRTPRLPQCAYAVFCLYTLHATQECRPPATIRVPQHAWRAIETLLRCLAASPITLHAAHALASLHRSNALEFTASVSRSRVAEAADWQCEWSAEVDQPFVGEVEPDTVDPKHRLEDPKWTRVFATELEELAASQTPAYAQIESHATPPLHLDPLRVDLDALLPRVKAQAQALRYERMFRGVQTSLPFRIQNDPKLTLTRLAAHRVAPDLTPFLAAEEEAAMNLTAANDTESTDGKTRESASAASASTAAASSFAAPATSDDLDFAMPTAPPRPYSFHPLPVAPSSLAGGVVVPMPVNTTTNVIPVVKHAGLLTPSLQRPLVPPLGYRRAETHTTGLAPPPPPTEADAAFIASLERLLYSDAYPDAGTDSNAGLPSATAASDAMACATFTSFLLSTPARDPSQPLAFVTPQERPLQPLRFRVGHTRRHDDVKDDDDEDDDDAEPHVFLNPSRPSQSRGANAPPSLPIDHDAFADGLEKMHSAHALEMAKLKQHIRVSATDSASSRTRNNNTSYQATGATFTQRIQRMQRAKTNEVNRTSVAAAAADVDVNAIDAPLAIPPLASRTTVHASDFRRRAANVKARMAAEEEMRYAERVAVKHERGAFSAAATAAAAAAAATPPVHHTPIASLGTALDGYRGHVAPTQVSSMEGDEEHTDTDERKHGAHPETPLHQGIVGEALADLMTFHGGSSILRTPLVEAHAAPSRTISTLELSAPASDERKENADASENTSLPDAAAANVPSTPVAASPLSKRAAAQAHMKQKREAAKRAKVEAAAAIATAANEDSNVQPVASDNTSEVAAPVVKTRAARKRKAPAVPAPPSPPAEPLDPVVAAQMADLRQLEMNLLQVTSMKFDSDSGDDAAADDESESAHSEAAPPAKKRVVKKRQPAARPAGGPSGTVARAKPAPRPLSTNINDALLGQLNIMPSFLQGLTMSESGAAAAAAAAAAANAPSAAPSFLPPSGLGQSESAEPARKTAARKRKQPAEPKPKRGRKAAASSSAPVLPVMPSDASAIANSPVVGDDDTSWLDDDAPFGDLDDFDLDLASADDADQQAESDRLASQPSDFEHARATQRAREEAVGRKRAAPRAPPKQPRKPRQKKTYDPYGSIARQSPLLAAAASIAAYRVDPLEFIDDEVESAAAKLDDVASSLEAMLGDAANFIDDE